MFKLIMIVVAGSQVFTVGPVGDFRTEAECYANVDTYIGLVVETAKKHGVYINELKYKCGRIGDPL